MRTWPSRPSCRADCETPVDHSRSDTSREGKQMTIFLHSARTISRIFVFEAGGLRRRKAVEIRPAPHNGMIETYVVEERGFRKGMHSIPDHYQMKVRKVGTMRSKPNLRLQTWA